MVWLGIRATYRPVMLGERRLPVVVGWGRIGSEQRHRLWRPTRKTSIIKEATVMLTEVGFGLETRRRTGRMV